MNSFNRINSFIKLAVYKLKEIFLKTLYPVNPVNLV